MKAGQRQQAANELSSSLGPWELNIQVDKREGSKKLWKNHQAIEYKTDINT